MFASGFGKDAPCMALERKCLARFIRKVAGRGSMVAADRLDVSAIRLFPSLSP